MPSDGHSHADPQNPSRLIVPILPDCRWLGVPINGSGNGMQADLRVCMGRHHVCRASTERDGIMCCLTCDDHTEATRPSRLVSISPAKLAPVKDGRHFNGAIFDYKGRTLLAYRAGWRGPSIHIAELGPDLQPISNTPLSTNSLSSSVGSEDPRLFTFRGKLHISFNGVTWLGEGLSTTVLVAELSDDLRVQWIWEPKYDRRTYPMEKNWTFFEFDRQLYSLYAIHPEHKILKVSLGRSELVHETTWDMTYTGGVLRGGAPPVRVGDEFYSFFHGVRWENDIAWYSVGCYVFAAQPPFRVLRYTPHPIQLAKPLRLDPKSNKSVVFPCGAILRGQEWLVSSGMHDCQCIVAVFNAGKVEGAMVEVANGVKTANRALVVSANPERLFSRYASGEEYCDLADHLTTLRRIARGTVLEIGANGGIATAAFLLGVEQQGGRVFSLDPEQQEQQFAGHPQWECIPAPSKNGHDEVLSKVGPHLDVLFIHLNQSYTVVKHHLETYGPLVRPGGVILVHYIELQHLGIGTAVVEFAAKVGVTLRCEPGSFGLGIIEVT